MCRRCTGEQKARRSARLDVCPGRRFQLTRSRSVPPFKQPALLDELTKGCCGPVKDASDNLRSLAGKEHLRCPSASTRCIKTPTPSITPSRIPHAMPDETIIFGPPCDMCISDSFACGDAGSVPRTARHPPVKNPAVIAFQASSFCL